jgi:hypothetical protein
MSPISPLLRRRRLSGDIGDIMIGGVAVVDDRGLGERPGQAADHPEPDRKRALGALLSLTTGRTDNNTIREIDELGLEHPASRGNNGWV